MKWGDEVVGTGETDCIDKTDETICQRVSILGLTYIQAL